MYTLKYRKRIIVSSYTFLMRLFNFFLILILLSFFGYTTPLQILLEPIAKPICDIPLEIKVYILDEKGNIVFNYNGEKKVEINVKEQGGENKNGFDIPTEYVRFKKGIGYFSIKSQEEETLEIKVEVEDIRLPGYISLSFKKKGYRGPLCGNSYREGAQHPYSEI